MLYRVNVLSNRAKRSVSISALRRSSASHNKATISTAIWRAADIIIEKGKRIAAEALEAAEADIRFEEGRFIVAGTDRAIGAHVVEVEIDRDTGEVNLAGYTAVAPPGLHRLM
jgi:CO/xanthine dehydrogenase Mo-binding subunit